MVSFGGIDAVTIGLAEHAPGILRGSQPGLSWAVKTLLLREQLDCASFLPRRLIEQTGKPIHFASVGFNRRGSICQLRTLADRSLSVGMVRRKQRPQKLLPPK